MEISGRWTFAELTGGACPLSCANVSPRFLACINQMAWPNRDSTARTAQSPLPTQVALRAALASREKWLGASELCFARNGVHRCLYSFGRQKLVFALSRCRATRGARKRPGVLIKLNFEVFYSKSRRCNPAAKTSERNVDVAHWPPVFTGVFTARGFESDLDCNPFSRGLILHHNRTSQAVARFSIGSNANAEPRKG